MKEFKFDCFEKTILFNINVFFYLVTTVSSTKIFKLSESQTMFRRLDRGDINIILSFFL